METPVPIPLDARKQQILKAVVADYTRTGVPVGSHALAIHLASWSSATIRNDLANLVEVGYLLQPHTSAGRVPSDLGYRYYVDFLMEEEPVPVGRAAPDGSLLRAADRRPRGDARGGRARPGAGHRRGEHGHRATRVWERRLKHLDLISLEPRHALVLLVLEGNLIRQQPIALARDAEQAELSALAHRLNGALEGADSRQVAATPAANWSPRGPCGRRSRPPSRL